MYWMKQPFFPTPLCWRIRNLLAGLQPRQGFVRRYQGPESKARALSDLSCAAFWKIQYYGLVASCECWASTRWDEIDEILPRTGMNFESSHLRARNQHRRALNTIARLGEVVGRSEAIEVNSDAVRCPWGLEGLEIWIPILCQPLALGRKMVNAWWKNVRRQAQVCGSSVKCIFWRQILVISDLWNEDLELQFSILEIFGRCCCQKRGGKNGQVAAPAWMCAWMTCGMICRAGGELILQESIGNLAADGSSRFAGLSYIFIQHQMRAVYDMIKIYETYRYDIWYMIYAFILFKIS